MATMNDKRSTVIGVFEDRDHAVAAIRDLYNAGFPEDRIGIVTVPDARQISGRRVHLPVPRCTARTSSVCDGLVLLNQLDGFDIRPRVYVPFSGPIDVQSVTPKTLFVDGPGDRTGLIQVVWDPSTHILEGTVERQLAEDTTYRIVVTRGVHDASGVPIDHAVRVPFTTETASLELDHIRRSLDSARVQGLALLARRGRLA